MGFGGSKGHGSPINVEVEARQRCEFDLGLQHKKEPEVISLPLPSLVCCCCWKPKP